MVVTGSSRSLRCQVVADVKFMTAIHNGYRFLARLMNGSSSGLFGW
jgi:hypothetical protein